MNRKWPRPQVGQTRRSDRARVPSGAHKARFMVKSRLPGYSSQRVRKGDDGAAAIGLHILAEVRQPFERPALTRPTVTRPWINTPVAHKAFKPRAAGEGDLTVSGRSIGGDVEIGHGLPQQARSARKATDEERLIARPPSGNGARPPGRGRVGTAHSAAIRAVMTSGPRGSPESGGGGPRCNREPPGQPR